MVHRRSLAERETATHQDIPVTSPAVTLTDLAAGLTEQPPRSRDQRGGQARPDPSRAAPSRARRNATHGPGSSRSSCSSTGTYSSSAAPTSSGCFIPIARRAALGPPLTQVRVNGFEVDFFWPDDRPHRRVRRRAIPPRTPLATRDRRNSRALSWNHVPYPAAARARPVGGSPSGSRSSSGRATTTPRSARGSSPLAVSSFPPTSRARPKTTSSSAGPARTCSSAATPKIRSTGEASTTAKAPSCRPRRVAQLAPRATRSRSPAETA